MKFCYIDESGTGDEPYAVMVGVIVDALRMRPTKADWDDLLRHLEAIVATRSMRSTLETFMQATDLGAASMACNERRSSGR